MAFPSTAIKRTELSTGVQEFALEASRRGFVGPSVLVPRVVGKQAADVGSVPLEQLLKTTETKRAPKSGYNRDDFSFEALAYSCQEHGAEEPLDDAEIKKYSDILDAEAIHTQRAVDRVLRNYEIAVSAAVFDTATWTIGNGMRTDVSACWDVPATAVPISDVQTAARAVWSRTGLWPNTLVLNKRTFDDCRNAESVLERVLYSGNGNSDPANVTAQTLAALFGLDKVLVAAGAKNTAKEGQTASISPIWADSYAMLCATARTDDMAEPCIGRTFLWSEDGAGAGDDSELGILLEEYREEAVRGSVLRARTYYHA